jgi:transcriptional regulator with XRE-family HTH domain
MSTMADRIHIDSRIRELVVQHGSLRAVARAKSIDAGYLSKLLRGSKENPSDEVLRKLGLQRVRYFESLEVAHV